ncbi:thioredoxin-like protein [Phanerochaete sordida]|uniref:Thioredoxin-like protein n=1 Tax=Phanerochaete sordida TaxID=48140 RepID=A0A9P3FYG2_9APHY|nr:thioredoxin-like protein [Phanerochaete sordida]
MPQPHKRHEGSDVEDSDEELFAELEAELENDESAAVRERGLEQLKKQMEALKKLKDTGHGQYSEILDEKQVLQATVSEPLCVVHFYHSNFRRCKIMDKHLAKLAPKYFHTRFIRVFVENVPFLVTKLGVKVLPAVWAFVDGVSKDRIIGFEELGNEDDFQTSVLESRLLRAGVIRKELEEDSSAVTYGTSSTTVTKHIRGGNGNSNAEDDFEFDL